MRHANDKSARLKRGAFLAAYAVNCNISAACRAAGIGRSAFYDWIKDPAFKTEFEEAKENAIEALELECRRRAEHGTETYVTHKGKLVLVPVNKEGKVVAPDSPEKVGEAPLVEREFSDTLAIFLLKANRPDVYRERHEVKVTEDDTLEMCESVAKLAAATRKARGKAKAETKG